MNSSKKRVLTEQVRRLRARFAQSVDTLLGEVIPAELLKQWVLEEVVQWRERLYGPLTTLVLFLDFCGKLKYRLGNKDYYWNQNLTSASLQ
jgi:hypothetical protein